MRITCMEDSGLEDTCKAVGQEAGIGPTRVRWKVERILRPLSTVVLLGKRYTSRTVRAVHDVRVSDWSLNVDLGITKMSEHLCELFEI